MYEFQQFVDQLDRHVRADSRAERSWYDERDVGLHVLGGRMHIYETRLYGATEFV